MATQIMTQEKTKERKEVPTEDRWNVEALYSSMEEWRKDFTKWARESKGLRWPELSSYKGKLKNDAKTLKSFIDLCIDLDRNLSKLYTYAHLRHDEDVADDENKKAYIEISNVISDFRKETAWIEPEILQIPEERMKEFLQSDILKEYKIYLEKMIRMKPHTLSADKEELMALTSQALDASSRAFSSFNNADLKFPPVLDQEGKERELTHGKYSLYMRGRDRKLREGAFKNLHKSFLAYENTLCDLINGEVQAHLFNMRARGYSSCLEAALFPNQIPTSVYSSLIQAVRKNLGSLHKYVALRKKVLGFSELHPYDMQVPLVADVDMSLSYEEAEDNVINSVVPLGPEYQKTLQKGLKTDRWVDRYENLRKRSGAYSSGCYDSMPYILMNYNGTFNDAMTLAHEAGHSMHSFLSHQNQPYQYAGYPIFVAEVASTFNEELMMQHMISKKKSKEEKCYLINQKIEDIRATLFRQAMFAEFELKVHQWVEEGVPLTPSLLKTEYRKLNQDYFGPNLVLDEEIDIEWARIPHFYYNFYVYQYATGISAALALADKVKKGDEEARKKYLQFLSSGSSRFPIDLLRLAGVDMSQPDPVESAIAHFDKLVDELSSLLVG